MFWNTQPDKYTSELLNSLTESVLSLQRRVNQLEEDLFALERSFIPINTPTLKMHLEASGEVTRGQDVQ